MPWRTTDIVQAKRQHVHIHARNTYVTFAYSTTTNTHFIERVLLY